MAIEEPIQEKAMAALADVLSDLSGVRPGGWIYPRTPAVDRVLPPASGQQMPSDMLPRLFVIPSRSSRLQQIAARSGAAYRHQMQVDIHGLVEDADDVIGDTWRWRLRHDVLATMHQHLSLMGTVERIDFSTREESVDAGETAPKLWFLQPITLWLKPQHYETAA